jgi:hypothetical protein
MTKVEARYELTQPVDDALMNAIARAHGHYGLQAVKLHPKLDGLTVVYDASRMTLTDVDRALHTAGLPVRRLD